MSNLKDALHIPDTQSARDERHLAIQRVGIKDVRYPLELRIGEAVLPTVAQWDLDVALPAEQKGTHMSRFIGWLNDIDGPMDAASLRRGFAAMLGKLQADEGRIEARFPDPIANPYLAFAALMMAGLDGVQNKLHPGDPADKNLYDLPPEEDAKIPTVCSSLDQALESLDRDREFLTRGGVFTNDMIDAYIALKMEEVQRIRMTTHPAEFDMYYSL